MDNPFDSKEFEDVYISFTVHSINGTFKHGFNGNERKIVFIAKKEDSDWLNSVCESYKKEYGEEIEYVFEKNLCYWKEK